MVDKIKTLKFITTSRINCVATNTLAKYEILENDVCIAEKELAGVKSDSLKVSEIFNDRI